MYKFHLKNKLVFIFTAVAAVFAGGLFLNAYYQALTYYNSILPNNNMAVFIQRDTKVSWEVIGEKIMNLEGIKEAKFIPKEKIYEDAVSINSSLKDMISGSDNPFTPYFMVYPENVSMQSFEKLREQISAIEGIDDIKYDLNLVAVTDNLGRFVSRYFETLKIILVILGILFFMKIVVTITKNRNKHIFHEYLFSAGMAVIASAAGVLFYYLFSNYLYHFAVLKMPDKYLLYLAAAGIIAVLNMEM